MSDKAPELEGDATPQAKNELSAFSDSCRPSEPIASRLEK
jgi:hypothetical protein